MYWCIQTDDRNTNLTNLLGDDQRQLLSEDGGHHLICPGCPGGGAHGCRKEHFHCDSDWCEIWSCEGRGVGSNGWSCTTVELKSTRFWGFFSVTWILLVYGCGSKLVEQIDAWLDQPSTAPKQQFSCSSEHKENIRWDLASKNHQKPQTKSYQQ